MANINPSNMLILVFFGGMILLAGILLYYIEFAINGAVNLLLETIALGFWNDSTPVFDEYYLPNILIGIGLICIAIPFLIYFGGIIEKILREKTYSIRDSIILSASSFIVVRFVDFTTTSLEGIDRTVPYTLMGLGFAGIIMPVALFVGFILRNKIRNKKTLGIKEASQIVRSLSAKDFLWILSSGITIILLDHLFGKVHFDDEAVIPRILADFGYVYVIIPLSIYLRNIVYKIRHKKEVDAKNLSIYTKRLI
jgi:hypothetical protein